MFVTSQFLGIRKRRVAQLASSGSQSFVRLRSSHQLGLQLSEVSIEQLPASKLTCMGFGRPQLLAGYGRSKFPLCGPFPRLLSIFVTWQLAFPEQVTQEKEREPKMEATGFCHLILELTYLPSCCVRLDTQTKLVYWGGTTKHPGCGY